jgi:pimeloyl-ACP methyl ester carboxylesterase
MIPYYFGSSDRRLFGCYHDPPAGGAALGIVLCNPLGREYFPAHKTVRFLASKLAERGIHVLRFDYYGTGDSDGSDVDACMDSLMRDVGIALEELQEVSGAVRVGLVGIRGGAEVAVRVSKLNEAIARLVLWDPVAPSHKRGTNDDAFRAPHGSSGEPPPILLVSTRPEGDRYRPVVDALTRWAGAPALAHAPAARFWSEHDPGSGGLPVAAVQEVVEWLSN